MGCSTTGGKVSGRISVYVSPRRLARKAFLINLCSCTNAHGQQKTHAKMSITTFLCMLNTCRILILPTSPNIKISGQNKLVNINASQKLIKPIAAESAANITGEQNIAIQFLLQGFPPFQQSNNFVSKSSARRCKSPTELYRQTSPRNCTPSSPL